LNELKIGTSNQEGLEKATLQCDQMLECVKATNGHATMNILKRCQSLIDGPSIPIPKTLSFNWFKPITPTSYNNPSLYYTPFGGYGEKSMIKSEMLQS
jgi:hypothetical protein